MSCVVVLDACVLYSAALRDILLRLGEIGLLSPRWSERILDETVRALRRTRPDLDERQVNRLVDCMRRAFPEAMTEPSRLAPLGLPDPDDEHVVAVAVASAAEVLLTCNVRDFPVATIARVTAVRILSPDELLMSLLEAQESALRYVIRSMAADLRNPPITPERLLEGLRMQAPGFVEAYVRSRRGE